MDERPDDVAPGPRIEAGEEREEARAASLFGAGTLDLEDL